MKQIDTSGQKSYRPQMSGDPLIVEKGYSHFHSAGRKDFLVRIKEYEVNATGLHMTVETFRGETADVSIAFPLENVFRFVMVPGRTKIKKFNSVFQFSHSAEFMVEEEKGILRIQTRRLELCFRTCPFEMSVQLDGKPLTKEQIRDFNVDQKYKAIPIGFTVDESGKVTDAFETYYMHADESFYGFGEKFTGFNKRGQKIDIWQRDAQSTNSDVSYKGMPYFVSSYGYSVLLNTFTRSHFNMGASSGVSYTMETEDPYLDYYMFCERDLKQLLSDYTELSGRSPMIPRWSLGFWMSKMSYMSREEVETVVDRMASFGMSFDVIHIDSWMDTFSSHAGKDILQFDEERFPDPEEMIRSLGERGVHLSLWMYPYVAAVRTNPLTGEVMSDSAQFQHMKERGFLVLNPQGEPYVFGLGEGDVADQGVAALDFTNPECVAYVSERVEALMEMGVGVIKTDFSEELPEDAVFFDGTTGLQGHNKYTLLYAKTIYEASDKAKKKHGKRALLWGRSGFAGSQNYPANWAGDSSAATNNLACILNGGLSIGLSGISFWGFDIGGFYNCDDEGSRVIPDDESYIRSVQMGLMAPLSRSHGQSTSREPWVFSETAQEAFLIINKLRYKLLPYIYSAAYETHLYGWPMMRAMLLEFPNDRTVYEISTQYMFGKALLVAPVFDQQEHYVYLPAGKWVDLQSGEMIDGGRWITPGKDIRKLPIYLRENCAVAMFEEAPVHIEDKNFTGYDLVINIKDHLETTIYDDETAGKLKADLADGCLKIETQDIPFKDIKVYSDMQIRETIVNGKPVKL